MTLKEWESLRELADGTSINKIQAGKGSCVAVWRSMTASKKQRNSWKTKFAYKGINFKEKILSYWWIKVIKLKGFKFILEKELKYFFYDFKKTANLLIL